MRATIKAADATKVATVITAETTRQGSVAAARHNVGYIPGFPTGNSTYVAAEKAANSAKLDALIAAETVRQGAVFAAKDLLRSQGEIPF